MLTDQRGKSYRTKIQSNNNNSFNVERGRAFKLELVGTVM